MKTAYNNQTHLTVKSVTPFAVAKALPLFTSSDLGVQAVEKPKKPLKFGKIVHQNQGDADGQIYSLRLQPKPHGCHQF